VAGIEIGVAPPEGERSESQALQVGDRVELITLPAGCSHGLRVGMVGTVVCADFSWGAVSTEWDERCRRPSLLRPSYLRLVARPASSGGEGA
jgi:hypothetical protein